MVEVPVNCDPSSGLLPGETLSRRRQPEVEPESEEAIHPSEQGTEEEFEELDIATGEPVIEIEQGEIEQGEFEMEEFEEEELLEEAHESEALPPSLREIENPQESTAPATIGPRVILSRIPRSIPTFRRSLWYRSVISSKSRTCLRRS